MLSLVILLPWGQKLQSQWVVGNCFQEVFPLSHWLVCKQTATCFHLLCGCRVKERERKIVEKEGGKVEQDEFKEGQQKWACVCVFVMHKGRVKSRCRNVPRPDQQTWPRWLWGNPWHSLTGNPFHPFSLSLSFPSSSFPQRLCLCSGQRSGAEMPTAYWFLTENWDSLLFSGLRSV